MEFYKTRRRNVWLVVAVLIGVQLCWALWSFSNMRARDLEQGWMAILYQFPLLNSIMMPVIAAVVASRLSDVEHKGETFKLLETVMSAGRLFDAKFLCGAVYMVSAAVLQLLVIIIAGYLKGFEGEVPISFLGYYLLFTTGVNLTILLLQQVLSLLFANQMVPFSVGLIGAFAGLLTMFFPQSVQKLILWGYYGVLMFVTLDWDQATRISDYYWLPINWSGFAVLTVIFGVIYLAGRTLFVRKEI
ncbi:ABC transporter permease [Desulfosporosinus fructosivorans]|uniref:ABC transporter permease n=1 Tax=Desulfosporosinus fructosivorans TaxID=2018669 RepID=A0A4Z0QZU1_9FIRM|nr:ABC transporter permease [Desulfosporosinus fructosivorans]TGE35789.1 ABC transporter permease [Desulfosporosinus fructosivorans]